MSKLVLQKVFHPLFVFKYSLLYIAPVSIVFKDNTGNTIQQTAQCNKRMKLNQ